MSRRSRPREGWLPVAVAAASAALFWVNAFRGFNFFDMSFNLDGGWRVLHGQRPYEDFIYFAGPGHLWLMGAFFGLFGFGRTAIWAHLALVNAAVIAAVYAMVRRRMPIGAQALVLVLTAASFYWPVSHPWHDQSAHLWGILALAVYLHRTPDTPRRRECLLAAACGALAAASLLTKTNIGLAYVALFFILFAGHGVRRPGLAGYCAGGLAALFVASLFFDWRLALQQMLAYTRMISGVRWTSLLNPAEWLANFYWLIVLLVLVNVLPLIRRRGGEAMLAAGLFFVSVLSVMTGGVQPSDNVFLWGIDAAVAFVILYRVRDDGLAPRRRVVWRVSVATLSVLCLALTMRAAVIGWNWEVWSYSNREPVGEYVIQAPPLAGWHCNGRKGKAVEAILKLLNGQAGRDDKLLVVTDLQILYALTGRDSYRGIPLFIMRRDHMPVPGEQADAVRQRLALDPPDWIVTDKADFFDVMPYLHMDKTLRKKYTLVQDFGPYVVFNRRD